MGKKELYEALKPFCEKINSLVENDNEICIITHLDADGIAAGSNIFTALT
jgi:single-stranded DNA-specific DHH superfamily exonuclease